MKYYFGIVLLLVYFTGCSSPTVKKEYIEGVSDVNQDVSFYLQDINENNISSMQKYLKDYYKQWHIEKPTITQQDAMWANNTFHLEKYYGENFQKISPIFYKKLIENTNFEAFASLNKKAYTLERVNVRAFPTNRMFFLNPVKAGEGFPFDYLQNSSIAAYKPVFISHYSKDKAWVFVESSFTYGWVPTREIAFISDKKALEWEKSPQEVVVEDNIAVYDKNQNFIFYSQIGQMLPLKSNIDFSKNIFHQGLLSFNKKNIALILSQLQHNIYGWGGMYGQRDCSATLRDFYAPFGIWLPRNSSKQAKIGQVINLEGMSDKQKLATIKKFGVAFQTLLYKKGHIVLYVGTFNNRVIIFHNTWGIKTIVNAQEGRYIIGKPIFSTLDFGKNIEGYQYNNTILHHLQSMNIITK